MQSKDVEAAAENQLRLVERMEMGDWLLAFRKE